MDQPVWNSETALQWNHAHTEWARLDGSQFASVSDLADRLRRLNRQMAALQRSSRMTNAQMNSRLILLCDQMGYNDMSRDVVMRDSAYLFSADEKAWIAFDELVDRYINFESWKRQDRNGHSNGYPQAQTHDRRPPRTASLENSMNAVTINEPPQSFSRSPRQPSSWDRAPEYTEDPSFEYSQQDQKSSPPGARKRPDVQKRPLQRSGTQRAFDFMARQSQMPAVPSSAIDDQADDLAPPPPLLSPREIRDKRSSRRSMRYDTEEFMS